MAEYLEGSRHFLHKVALLAVVLDRVEHEAHFVVVG